MNWDQFLTWFKGFLNRAFNPFCENNGRQLATLREFLRNAFWPFKETEV